MSPPGALAGRTGFREEPADSLFGAVHAVPSAQFGRGVKQSHLSFRNLDFAQFLEHLCSLGKEMSVLHIWHHDPLFRREAETLNKIPASLTPTVFKPKVKLQLPSFMEFLTPTDA